MTKAGLTKKSVRNVLNASTKTICDAFSSEETVALAGFGTFQVANRESEKRSKFSNKRKYPDTG